MPNPPLHKPESPQFCELQHLPAIHDDFASHVVQNLLPFIFPEFFMVGNNNKYYSHDFALAIDEPSDLTHYLLDLFFAEFGVHRQGKHLLLCLLAFREVTRFIAQILVNLLEMKG